MQRVKRLFNARKAGHTGSLDPLASGLLPVCFGQATKISAFLLDADKSYTAVVRLGVRTDTGDADGIIREQTPVPALDINTVRELLAGFKGNIKQTPPMYSAIKVGGTPLYKLAYQGIEIERRPRQVVIHEIELLSLHSDVLEIRVSCSKGTYIRTLAEDIGVAMGCGAHILRLRRHRVGPFDDRCLVPLDHIEALASKGGVTELDSLLKPADDAILHWPSIELADSGARQLRSGQAVTVRGAPLGAWVRIYGGDGHFMAVGRVLDNGRVVPKRLIAG